MLGIVVITAAVTVLLGVVFAGFGSTEGNRERQAGTKA